MRLSRLYVVATVLVLIIATFLVTGASGWGGPAKVEKPTVKEPLKENAAGIPGGNYKKTCGEIFDLVTSKGLVPADKAAAIEAAIQAK